MTIKPASIDDYLDALTPDKRQALERLRKLIRAAAPGAEECISYNLPAFRLDGKTFFWFGAGADHIALYGVSEPEPGDFKDYNTSGKGTLRLKPNQTLPAALVRKLVKARIAKIANAKRKPAHPKR